MKEQKTPQLPRKVMAKEHHKDPWFEAELIADLTQFGISIHNFPFMLKHDKEVGEYTITSYMMEIEDYKKKFEPKKPMSFGKFSILPRFDEEDLDHIYNQYQEYLKTFEK